MIVLISHAGGESEPESTLHSDDVVDVVDVVEVEENWGLMRTWEWVWGFTQTRVREGSILDERALTTNEGEFANEDCVRDTSGGFRERGLYVSSDELNFAFEFEDTAVKFAIKGADVSAKAGRL